MHYLGMLQYEIYITVEDINLLSQATSGKTNEDQISRELFTKVNKFSGVLIPHVCFIII